MVNMKQYGKNHDVPQVSNRPITRSKDKKINQAFILQLQNWIGSAQRSFHELQANSKWGKNHLEHWRLRFQH